MSTLRLSPLCRFCLAIAMAFAWLSAFGREATYCGPTRALKKHEGEYARNDIWEKLRTARDWTAMDGVVSRDNHLVSITISATGSFVGASNQWHEGANACIKFRGNELWATPIPWEEDQQLPQDLQNAVWIGPFVRIGTAVSPQAHYFRRVFGNKCFQSNTGRSWCFGPDYIEVDRKIFTPELLLDINEMPRDGFPVTATDKETKKKHLWVFRRERNGWIVFDEKLKFEDRLAEEQNRKPWQTLTPLAN